MKSGSLAVGLALLMAGAGGWTALAVDTKPITLIAIGDSITEAYRVIPQTYRYHLAKLMDEKGVAYDFVGNRKGVLQNAGDGSVDLDYEAYSGETAEQVIPKALATIKREKPDVAIVHLGTNDILKGQGVDNAMADMAQLVAGLKEANPKVKIFVAMIPWNNKPLIEELNERLKKYQETEKNVFHVEMRPFELNKYYRDFPKYSLHPNEAGAKRMADMFFAAMSREVFDRKRTTGPSGDVLPAEDRELRTWTSAAGKTVEARLLKTEGGGTVAVLGTKDGKRLKIGVSQVSPADRKYVENFLD